jgi:hypothetical protein
VSLDKAIQHGAEHRKQYYGSRAFDASCRNHGDCPWCRRARQFKRMRAVAAALDAIREHEEGDQ